MASLHPDDAAKMLADREAWVRAGAPGWHRATYRVRHRNGSILHFEVLRIAERDAEGQPIRIVSAMRDQTEMHLAAQALQDSEARMRLAVEAADIGVFEYDVETGDGYWSDRAWRMRGLEPRDGILAPEKVMALVHPDDLARTRQTVDVRGAQSDGTSHEYEFRVFGPMDNRQSCPRLTRRGADGRSVKVIGVNIDIHRAHPGNAPDRTSEARFAWRSDRQLGVWDYDPDGRDSVVPRMWEIRAWRRRGAVCRSMHRAQRIRTAGHGPRTRSSPSAPGSTGGWWSASIRGPPMAACARAVEVLAIHERGGKAAQSSG